MAQTKLNGQKFLVWGLIVLSVAGLTGCCHQKPEFIKHQTEGLKYEKKHKLGNAKKEYEKACVICPKNKEIQEDKKRVQDKIKAHWLYKDGKKLFRQGNYPDAYAKFTKAHKLWAGYPGLEKKLPTCKRYKLCYELLIKAKELWISQRNLSCEALEEISEKCPDYPNMGEVRRLLRQCPSPVPPPDSQVLPAPECGDPLTHVVRSGESLSRILTDYYKEYKSLIRFIEQHNHIERNAIFAGQQLSLPGIKLADGTIICPEKKDKPDPQDNLHITDDPVIVPVVSCDQLFEEAVNLFGHGNYTAATEKFEETRRCEKNNCPRCQKYIVVIQGIQAQKKKNYPEAIARFDEAVNSDSGNRMKPDNQKIRSYRQQAAFKAFKSYFDEAIQHFKNTRKYQKRMDWLQSGNKQALLRWLGQPYTTESSQQKLNRARQYMQGCDECLTYEESYKKRLYDEGVRLIQDMKDQSDLLKAIIALELVHFADPAYKDVKAELSEARRLLKILIPI